MNNGKALTFEQGYLTFSCRSYTSLLEWHTMYVRANKVCLGHQTNSKALVGYLLLTT